MAIVVFDGECNVCSGAVRFILRNDVRGEMQFAAAQSEVGRHLLERHGLEPAVVETMLLIKADKALLRSDALLEIAKDLGWWRCLRVFRIVPKGLRDAAYRLLARHRRRWFGRRDACFIPTVEQRSRFLERLDDARLSANGAPTIENEGLR